MNILWGANIGNDESWAEAAKELNINMVYFDLDFSIDAFKRVKPSVVFINKDIKNNQAFIKATEIYPNIPIINDYIVCSNYIKQEKNPSMECDFAFFQNTEKSIKYAKELSKTHNIRCYFSGSEYYNVGSLGRKYKGAAFSSAKVCLVDKDNYLAVDILASGGSPCFIEDKSDNNYMSFIPVINNTRQVITKLGPFYSGPFDILTYKEALSEMIKNANINSKQIAP